MESKMKADELKDKGNAALDSGDVSEAIKLYTKAINVDSGNHLLFSNRSAAYCKAGKYEEALKDANITLKLKSDWIKGYSRKGTALTYLGRYEEALEAYRDGLKYDSNNQQLKNSIRQLELIISRNENFNINPFAEPNGIEKLQNDPRTKNYFNDPNYLPLLMELQQNPQSVMNKMNDPKVMNTLSVLLGVAPANTQDSSNINAETEPQPSNAENNVPMEAETSLKMEMANEERDKGNLEYKKRNFEAALSHYDKAIEINPTEMTSLTNKAAVYFEMKQYDKCIEECEKAIEIGKENRADFKKLGKAYARMAGAYQKMNDLHKAKTYYEKSLTENRNQDTLKKLREVEKHIKEEERKSYIDPEKSLEEKNKGKECFQRGDYPGAMKHYTEAIQRNPDDAVLFSNRAACYQKLAEFHLALRDCEECVKLDPTFVRGYIRKGMALMALKEYSKATLAFQKATELEPSNQEALDGYRKCLAVNSNNPKEMTEQAMSNPEIQNIIADPAMRCILNQMQNDPKALQEHLKNPDVAAKIQKLVECGIIAFR